MEGKKLITMKMLKRAKSKAVLLLTLVLEAEVENHSREVEPTMEQDSTNSIKKISPRDSTTMDLELVEEARSRCTPLASPLTNTSQPSITSSNNMEHRFTALPEITTTLNNSNTTISCNISNRCTTSNRCLEPIKPIQ